jgi:hypothetical protein
MMPPPELKARVLAAIGREPAPARPAVARLLVFAWSAALAVAFGIFLAIGGPHAIERPMPFVAATAVGWAAIALAATLGLTRRGTMLGESRVFLLVLPLILSVALVGLYALSLWGFAIPSEPVPIALGGVCLLLTLGMGTVLFAAFVWSRRDSDPVNPRATGAAAGATAGAWASVLIELHCDHAEFLHVTLGHVAPVFVLGAVGAVIGRRILGMHPDPSRTKTGSLMFK